MRTTLTKEKVRLKEKKKAISILEEKIKRLEGEDVKVKNLAKNLAIYLDLTIPKTKARIEIPRKYKPFFYRMGLENGISPLVLREYTGAQMKNHSIAQTERRQLIRVCIKNLEKKREWDRFKEFINREI